jgi:hypothetical protein
MTRGSKCPERDGTGDYSKGTCGNAIDGVKGMMMDYVKGVPRVVKVGVVKSEGCRNCCRPSIVPGTARVRELGLAGASCRRRR